MPLMALVAAGPWAVRIVGGRCLGLQVLSAFALCGLPGFRALVPTLNLLPVLHPGLGDYMAWLIASEAQAKQAAQCVQLLLGADAEHGEQGGQHAGATALQACLLSARELAKEMEVCKHDLFEEWQVNTRPEWVCHGMALAADA